MVALTALAMIACTTTNNTTDTGSTGTDTGTPAVDTGTPAVDTGTPAVDTGTPAVDTGTPAVDTGTPAADAGDPCVAYCTSVNSACTEANRQYGAASGAAMDSCLAVCAGFGWAAGTSGATSGDTLACRTYHAGAAATDATTHCHHAGPLGGGACGDSNCADFCAANLHVCTGSNAAYASMDACMTACGALSDATTVNAPTSTSGNTLACRTYHLTAALSDAATHCPHTAASGGGVCQ